MSDVIEVIEKGRFPVTKGFGTGGIPSWQIKDGKRPPRCGVAKLRYQLKMTQPELAKLLGWAGGAQISLYERGKLMPSAKTAKKLVAIAKQHGIEMTLEDFV